MFKYILTFTLFALSFGLQAQEVVRQHIGTQGISSPKKIHYTIGQSLANTDKKMHYGYQRPLLWSVGLQNTKLLQPELYPNPFTDALQFSGLPNGDILVQLHTVSGQLVVKKRFMATDQKFKMELNHLSAGTYLVSVQTLDQKAIFKVVKQ